MQRTPTILLCCAALVVASGIALARTNDQDPKKVDEFTGANWESAMARLDSFAVRLQNEPHAVGVLFVYAGQNRRRGEADAFTRCMKDYLVMRRKVDVNRLVFVSGGYRNNLSIEFWIASAKTQIPKPTSTIEPTSVRFKGKRISNWRSLCSI